MSKQVGISIAAFLFLIVIGAGLFLTTTQPRKTPQSQTTSSTQTTPSVLPQVAANTGSFQSLMATGKNQTCQFSSLDNTQQGTAYIGGNKLRGDFKLNSTDATSSHMIVTDGYAYLWTDSLTTGSKIKMDALTASTPPTTQAQTAELNKEVNLKCSDWVVDSSKFVTPANIQFTDLTNTLRQSGAPKIDKAICDNLQDPQAKASCLNAIGN